MRYPKVTQVAITLLHLTPLTDGFPWDDLRKILHRGQRMVRYKQRNIAKSFNLVSMAHECYRRQTDKRRVKVKWAPFGYCLSMIKI